MASGYTVRVHGLREFRSALRQAEGGLKEFRGILDKAAEPVRQEATARGGRYQGIGKYRTRVRGASAAVEQSAKTVTGQRGDFGPLQMRTVLEPALDARRDEVMRIFDDGVGEVILRAGL